MMAAQSQDNKSAAADRNQDRRFSLRRISVFGAAMAVVIALMGLLGYVPGLQFLGRIHEGYIPMAPSTAISFILLGGMLLYLILTSRTMAAPRVLVAPAALVAIFGLLEVAGHFSGRDLTFEDVLVPAAGHLGEIPIARMSPSTGIAFFFAGLAVSAIILRRADRSWRSHLNHAACCLGTLSLGISFVFCLAYLYGTPLLYGQGATVPMALTTALAFLMLGLATMGVSGGRAFPLSLLAGPSTRSQLLRVFLPLTIVSTLLGDIIIVRGEMFSEINPALVVATIAVSTAVIAGFVTVWFTRYVADAVDKSRIARDRAEDALGKSHDLMRAVMDGISDPIFLKDRESRYILLNTATARGLGRSSTDEVIGTDDAAHIPIEFARELQGKDRRVMESGESEGSLETIEVVGSTRFYQTPKSPYHDEEGNVLGVIGIARDITEQKLAAEEIESLARFPSENPNPVLRIAADGAVLHRNEAASILIEAWGCAAVCDLSAEPWQMVLEALDSGRRSETEIRCGDRTFSVTFAPVVDAGYVNISGLDITERKRVQEEYSMVLQTAMDGFWIVDSDGRLLDVNDAYCEMTGYTRDELLGISIPDLEANESPEETAAHIQQVIAAGSGRFETRHRCKDGRIIDVEISTRYMPDAERFSVFARDITARKRAEDDLRKQRYYLSRAQEIGLIGTWELDITKNELLWTDENYRIFGLPPGTALTYEIFLNCVLPEDREYVDTKWKAGMAGEPYDIEHRLIVDGEVKWVREKAELEFDDEGNCIRGTGFTQDITERKLGEEALRESEVMNRSLLDGIPGCIAMVLKKDTREIVASNKFAREVGAVPGQTCYKTCAIRDDSCPVLS